MRRAREIWVSIVGQYEKSGQTQAAFAAARGIPVGTLRSWIYKLRQSEADSAPLLPVRVVASAAHSARQAEAEGGAVELVVDESLRLRFPPGTAPAVIAEVTAQLRTQC